MANILKLDENWDFCFDPVDAGLIDQWYRKKPLSVKKVKIPHVWNLENNEEDAHIAYYFKEFAVDKKESPKRFFIRFESVHHHATVWLNGEEIGMHMGGSSSFEVDGSRFVRIGESNFLTIRVQTLDRQGKIGELTGPEIALGGPHARGAFAGLTGDVYLMMVGKAGIRCLNVFTDYEADRISIEAKFWNPKGFQAELEYELTSPSGDVGLMTKSIKFERENAELKLQLVLDNVRLWTPDQPWLYQLKVRLLGSYPVSLQFGMRGTDVEKGTFKLNQKNLKIKGVSYPWFFPVGHGLPVFPVDIKKEILLLKDAGINLLRSGGAPLPKPVLDICDEVGMMVLQETTCYNQKSSRDSLEVLKTQIQNLIDCDGSHPSVFGWVIGSENGSMVLENGNKLLRYAAELDPTRPIFSNFCSVTMDNMGGGKIDLGKAFQPSAQAISPFESHRLKIGFPVSVRTFSMLASYCTSKDGKTIADGVHGSKSFWERYNYLKDDLDGKVIVDGLGACMPESLTEILEGAKAYAQQSDVKDVQQLQNELTQGLKENGLDIWKDAESFWKEAAALGRQGLLKQIDALMSNTQISGYMLDSTADAGLNFSGLLNWFRKPKPILEALKKVNGPIHMIAEAEERTPYIGTSAAIKIHLINEDDLGEYNLQLRVKGPNGRVLHQESMPGKAKVGVNSLGRFKFPVGFEKGKFSFDLTLSKSNKEVLRTEENFFVPPEIKLDAVLKQVQLIGNFPDTLTISTSNDASTLVVIDIANLDNVKLKVMFDKVQQGATLILGCLTDEDARKLNGLKFLPQALNCFRASGAVNGSFHFATNAPEFKDLPSQCLLDQNYADIMPMWSLEPIANTKVAAGSVTMLPSVHDKAKLKWGVDIATLPLGKGKVVFYQLDIFTKLGKNALADALFSNLINALKK